MSYDYRKAITEREEKLASQYSDFNYDAEKDELFKLARQQLERKQQSGVSDTLARYAANTGMGLSSEAMSAAQQTASQYNSMIADALTDAEQKQYDRWNQEKAYLTNEIANLKSQAMADAQSRFNLGDLSGYENLGYDTTEYKKQLAAQKEAAAAASEKEALQLALTIAEKTGDTSGLKQFGIDVTGGTIGENAKHATVGKNGMTQAEYESAKEQLKGMVDTYGTAYKGTVEYDQYVREINNKLAELDRDYYQGFGALDSEAVMQILSNLDNTGSDDVDTGTYYALLNYFTENPVKDSKGNVISGEAALKYYGITNNNKKSYMPVFSGVGARGSDNRSGTVNNAVNKNSDLTAFLRNSLGWG